MLNVTQEAFGADCFNEVIHREILASPNTKQFARDPKVSVRLALERDRVLPAPLWAFFGCCARKADLDNPFVPSLPQQLSESAVHQHRARQSPGSALRKRHVVDEPEQSDHIACPRHVCPDQNVPLAELQSDALQ